MKKILFAIMSVALAIGLMGAAFAYFSDTETSTGNTFSAGTLNLEVNGENPLSSNFNETNLYPGWNGSYPLTVKNVGSIDGSDLKFWVEAIAVTDNPTASTISPAGSDTIDDVLEMTIYDDDTDTYLMNWTALNDLPTTETGAVSIGSLNNGVSRNLVIMGRIQGATTDNGIQGDSVSFTFKVMLTQ